MVDITYTTAATSEDFPDQITSDFETSPVFANETRWDAFFQSFDESPTITEISSTQLTMQDGDNSIELNLADGAGLSGIGSEEELFTAIEDGLADGTFSSLVARDATGELARLDFTSTGMTLTSGSQSIVLGASVPASLQELFELLDYSEFLTDHADEDISEEEKQELVDFLSSYNLTSVSFEDETTSFGFALSQTAISVNYNGYDMTVTGEFPDQFGALFEVTDALLNADEDAGFSDIDGLDLQTITLTNFDGEELFTVTGGFEETGTNVTVLGTQTADDVYNGLIESDDYTANLLGGDDFFLAYDLAAEGYYYTIPNGFLIDGGTGADTFEFFENTYNTSDYVIFNLATGSYESSFAEELLSGEITNFENLTFDSGTNLMFDGTSGDNILTFNNIGEYIVLNGGAGFDTIDASALNGTQEGADNTLAAFLDQTRVVKTAENVYTLEVVETGTQYGLVQDFEKVIFSDGEYDLETIAIQSNDAPTVSIDDQTVQLSQWTRLSDILNVEDADGDAIELYEIYDAVGSNNWYADGARVNATTGYQTADLDGIWVQGDTTPSDQTLWVRAYDGLEWSSWDALTLTTAVENSAPTLTVEDQTVAANEWTLLADVLSETDPDGDIIQTYEIYDAVGSDSWWADGTRVDASGGYQTTNLAGIWFQGDASQSEQSLWVRGFDGEDWSSWDEFQLTTDDNDAPVVTIQDQAVAPTDWTLLSDVMDVSDANGDAVTLYEIYDADGADSWWADGGRVDASGGYQTANLAGVWFQGDAEAPDQTLWVRAYDGTDWGAWDAFTVSSGVNSAPVLQVEDYAVGQSEWTRLSDVLTQSDADGDAVQTYEIYDAVGTNNWWADGARVNAISGYETDDLAGIWFQGDITASDQTLWVRGNDGEDWGDWDSFVLTTYDDAV